MEERHVPLSTVAGRLGVSERTVRRWIKAGKLRAYRPGRDFRIPESALTELVEESEVRPKAQAPPPEPSFNGILEEERRKPEYLREYLREQGIEINNSESTVLAQYIEVHEHPPPGPYSVLHVVREGESVDYERIAMLLAYVLATGMLSPEQTEAAREALYGELVGA